MSQSKNRHEASRWLLTAQQDIAAARTLAENSFYAQACFLAQQAGEKAMKALWYIYDHDPWGHSIQRLVSEFPQPSMISDYEELVHRAAALDRYYISTRYPNGLPDLTPGESYFTHDAESAISNAEVFIDAVTKAIG